MRYGRTPGVECLGKDRYHSWEAAQAVIDKMPTFARAYRCRICTYLHLTSKELHK
jgi:hypothetical protein